MPESVCADTHTYFCVVVHTQVSSHQWCCLLISPQDKRPCLPDAVPRMHTLAHAPQSTETFMKRFNRYFADYQHTRSVNSTEAVAQREQFTACVPTHEAQ